MGTITTTTTSLLRLLQLSSVSLPVGGFSFSQGLESAIERQWVTNSEETKDWLKWQLSESIGRIDLPVLYGAMQSMSVGVDDWSHWNDLALANRETKELRLTETAMGDALKRLMNTLSIPVPNLEHNEYSFVALFGLAARHWAIDFDLAAQGYVWSWLENQVAAATKLVPLGQSQAQLLLGELQASVDDAIDLAETLDESSLGGALPALAIASCWHETQYSRLFRS